MSVQPRHEACDDCGRREGHAEGCPQVVKDDVFTRQLDAYTAYVRGWVAGRAAYVHATVEERPVSGRLASHLCEHPVPGEIASRR